MSQERNIKGGSWTAQDRKRIAAQGLTLEGVERQLALFRRGIAPVRLERACRVGDGIMVVPQEERTALVQGYEAACPSLQVIKFVPASGAASRMFGRWYRCLNQAGGPGDALTEDFAADLGKYAFFQDLRAAVAARGGDLDQMLARRENTAILAAILTERGLNYGALPKALLKFHAYGEGNRTALEEHLVEAALYARDEKRKARLHFTVSREHRDAVQGRLDQVIPAHENRLDTRYDVGLSTQDAATNTLAVDPEYHPFRDEQGQLVFRPGGHGSLLANLNRLDADVIFLKNIDNVVPDRLKPETVFWKKILGGVLLRVQGEVFRSISLLERDALTEGDAESIRLFCEREMNIVLPEDFRERPLADRQQFLLGKLNRPLRVCGMVKNEGEPGGGPFWVVNREDEGTSLQIIESFQVAQDDPQQRATWSSATHFNPVDLVCGVRDWRGRKFDLTRFVDPETGSISRKIEKGKDLLALEWPGLWNGAMAFWNTIFVEVPLITFNPVKTMTDLIRPQHLPD